MPYLCTGFYCHGGVGTYYTISNNKKISEVISKKILKLYVHYWEVLIIVLPLLFSLCGLNFDLLTVIKTISGISHLYCAEWWFFLPYIVVTVLFSAGYILLHDIVRTHLKASVIFCLICSELIELTIPLIREMMSDPLISIIISGIAFLPAFLTGALLAKCNILGRIKYYNDKHKLISRMVGILGIISVFLLKNNFDSHEYISATLFVVFLVLLSSPMNNRIIHCYGNHSIKNPFRHLQMRGEANWKMLDKHPRLRPFAWMYQAVRYANRGIRQGVGIIDLKKDLKESKRRSAIIEKLGARMLRS